MIDLEFLNDVKSNSSNSSNFEIRKELLEEVRCPKCNSRDIEISICRKCYYNLDFDLLGIPLGEKSFYTIREDYRISLSSFEWEKIKYFRDEIKHKSYLNRIKFRYNNLITYFYRESSLIDENRSLYLHELSDLIIELINQGIEESEIWEPLKGMSSTSSLAKKSLFERIKKVLEESNTNRREEKSKVTDFFDYKFAGHFSITSIFYFLAVIGLFISLSVAYFISQKYGLRF